MRDRSGAVPHLRRAAAGLRHSGRRVQPPGDTGLRTVVVDDDRTQTSREPDRGLGHVPQSADRAACRGSGVRGARAAFRRCDCGSPYPGQLRTRSKAATPPAGRCFLQPGATHGRRASPRKGCTMSLLPPRAAWRQPTRGPDRSTHRNARGGERRAGQPRAQLRSVSAAFSAADGAACRDRDQRGLCGGLRVQASQRARMAGLRGRKSDRRARRKAHAAVRVFRRHDDVDVAFVIEGCSASRFAAMRP